jgi:hypothetical protein
MFCKLRQDSPCLCRSYEDVYGDPGSPLVRRTKAGTYILAKVSLRWLSLSDCVPVRSADITT